MVIIYANGLVSISYSIWIWAIGKAQLHYWLQCPHRHFQNVTDRICCLRLKASALLAFVWVANEPTEWAKPAENASLFPEVNLTPLCNRRMDAWQNTALQTKERRWHEIVSDSFLPFPRHLFPKPKARIRAIWQKPLCNYHTCLGHHSVGGKTRSLSPLVNSRNHFFLFCCCTRTTPKAPGWSRSFSCVCATSRTVKGTFTRFPDPIPALAITLQQ